MSTDSWEHHECGFKTSQFGILIDLVIVMLFAPQPQLRSYLLRSLLPYHLMKHTQRASHVLPEDSQLWTSHGGTRTLLNSWTLILD